MTGIVLLTGATGFVGRQVLRALGERGARVRAVVREGKQDQLATAEAIETIVTTLDLFYRECRLVDRCLQGVDTFIHIAWYAGR